MSKRICLLTGYETDCRDGCYNCNCGGEEATKDMYVSINNVQRVCDIVQHMEDTSSEGEEIADFIRNELERMTVLKVSDVQPVKKGHWYHNTSKYISELDAYFIQACCSCCGRYSDSIDAYSQIMSNENCSHCGARMIKDSDING